MDYFQNQMKKLSKLGCALFAIAIAAFGIEYLLYASGVDGLRPGPPWSPVRVPWTWVIGCAFLLAALGIVIRTTARWAAILLAGAFLLRVLFIQLPVLFRDLHNPTYWTPAFEVLAMSGVALLVAGVCANHDSHPDATDLILQLGRFIFALSLPVFGIQHFLYAAYVATFIPGWIPGRLFWAYFVGVAFIAAAASIATRIKGTLAAILLGTMFFLWVLMLHLPRVASAPHNGDEWTSACVALAMAGGAFMLAGALSKKNEFREILTVLCCGNEILG